MRNVELVDVVTVCDQHSMAEQARGDHQVDVVAILLDGFHEPDSTIWPQDLKSVSNGATSSRGAPAGNRFGADPVEVRWSFESTPDPG